MSHLVTSIERYDAGFPFDLLIVDNGSKDLQQLSLLEKYSKKHMIGRRENTGRAQGGYDDAWQNNKDYEYYFFMHDDSAILRDNWLKVAVDRMSDDHIESDILEKSIPIGKVGFQTYEWGNKYQYLRTGHPQIFKYMDPVAELLDVKIPEYYQHINDDRYLIKNELLQKMGKIWNTGEFYKLEQENAPIFHNVSEWFEKNLPNSTPLPPYDGRYNAFQTCSEFLSDIAPMRYGYRTHCVLGDGYSQEEIGWTRFWGLEYINHYGCHNLFKRMALLFNQPEEAIRAKFKDKTFLQICDNTVKRETKYGKR